jgi:glycine/D-amino acid oxidase-like deaminating enzyme
MEPDYAIVGGGIVGLAVAHGLIRLGRRVLVLDEGDTAFRASRGNFGLVWVQSKGLDAPHYARWSQRSAALWRDLADELGAAEGTDLALRQEGGLDYHMTDASLEARVREYERLRDTLDGDYPFEVLGPNALRREEPNVGPRVAGAILHHQDGHVNPLRLLRALAGTVSREGTLRTGARVASVAPRAGGFEIALEGGERVRTARVVLCAGLGAAALGPSLGFLAPLRPQRGQVLITEKLAPLMRRPSGTIRQVDEGGVQIGDSKEEVGFDDTETLDVTAAIAARACAVFPDLSRARLVRSWGALRVMSPDGLPIYQQSPAHPGAFLVTCHSGVTLAAAHARLIPLWLEGRADAPELEVFGEHRFALPAAV